MNAIYDFAAQAGWVKGRKRTAEGVLSDIESGKILSEKELAGVNQFAQDVAFSLKKAAKAITDNPNFVRWFGKSKVVNESGEPLVVYHGSIRPPHTSDYLKARREIGKMAGIKTPPTIAETDFTWEKAKKYDKAIEEYIEKNKNTLSEELVYRALNLYRDIRVFDESLLGTNTEAMDAKAGFFFTPNKDFARRFTYNVERNTIAGRVISEKRTPKIQPKIYELYLSIQNPIDLYTMGFSLEAMQRKFIMKPVVSPVARNCNNI
jgi:hypothetical protein